MDASLQILTADVERVGGAVLTVLVAFASPDLAHEVADRMLASADPATRHRILGALRPGSGYPATPLGLEKALALTLAEEAPDLRRPRARRRCCSPTSSPPSGCSPPPSACSPPTTAAATCRGSRSRSAWDAPTLIPALAGLLDSLDADLRDRALSAIQGIRELERLQAEAGGTRQARSAASSERSSCSSSARLTAAARRYVRSRSLPHVLRTPATSRSCRSSTPPLRRYQLQLPGGSCPPAT